MQQLRRRGGEPLPLVCAAEEVEVAGVAAVQQALLLDRHVAGVVVVVVVVAVLQAQRTWRRRRVLRERILQEAAGARTVLVHAEASWPRVRDHPGAGEAGQGAGC